ncbi:MAG: winged helix-turn-helix domain-containing protein [Gemmatimonadota bacterium]|nr:winged helix-turn-helix domain-containing protein [Gemmatimonadota bacterium]
MSENPTRERTYRVERPGQLRALASPARHRIIAAFEALGRCSVRDLAEHMDVAPESLYYHVGQLEEAGLIVPAGTRPTGRRLAGLYELVARDIEVRMDEASPELREAYAEMAGSLLRWAERAHADALADREVRQGGPDRQRTLVQFHPRLSDEAVTELNARLTELERFLREGEDPAGTPYAVTVVVSPAG